MQRHLIRAPSNIALIKYMGKTDAQKNIPENASLSMTLDRLATWVEVESIPVSDGRNAQITILPEKPRMRADDMALRVPDLSENGRIKVIRHAEFVRRSLAEIFSPYGLELLHEPRDLVLKSANTFPEASGIASSASSFAAITLAVAAASARDFGILEQVFSKEISFKRKLAALSRQGSGSSCRSFEGPFVEWEGEAVSAVSSSFPSLRHFVVLISESAKAVSSSEAHLRVKTSPLWQGRKLRVGERLKELKLAMKNGDFSEAAKHTWQEAWEMHSLFHSSNPPFTYWKAGSVDALQWFSSFMISPDSAPLVTMDAGPNIHVIVRETEGDAWLKRLQDRFGSTAILQDRPGQGASFAKSEGTA